MARLTGKDIREMNPEELRNHMRIHQEDAWKVSLILWKSTLHMAWIALLYRLGLIKEKEDG